jgi:regulator of nucleoside diphosphate kinase
MIATTLTPNIIITDNDFDRLSELVRSPRYRVTHFATLSDLKNELSRGKVVSWRKVPRGAVTMRSQVRVRDLDTEETEVYALVYPEEADINQGKLSVLAPLGTALLGMRVGQTVEVRVPAGIRRLKVERILYQPESAGDLHL